MNAIYHGERWARSGVSTRPAATSVDTSVNRVINTLYGPDDKPIFTLVEHGEVPIGFQRSGQEMISTPETDTKKEPN